MTSPSRPRRRPAAVAAAALLLLAGALPAAAAYHAVAPEPGPARVRLVVAADADGETGATLHGTWTVLAPGAALEVPVTGAGSVRVETRPLYPAGDEPETFRFTVDYGDTVRRFLRRAAWETDVVLRGRGGGEPPRGPLGVGEVDRIDAEWTAGADTLRVSSREETRTVLVRVLLGRGLERPGGDAGKEEGFALPLDVDAALPMVGWDSNAYLTAKADSGRSAEWFLPVELDLRLDGSAGERTELEAWYSFDAAFYGQPVLDERRHRLRLRGDTRLGPLAAHEGVDLFYGYRFTHKNDSFNARGDREEFETIDPATGQPVSLADRFDYAEHEAHLGAGRWWGDRVETVLEGTYRDRDYVEDYADQPDIYSLDQRRWELEGAVVWRAARRWTVEGALTLRRRDYDEKFSRDANGDRVPGAATSLDDMDVELVVEYGRGAGFRAHGELKSYRSSDRYAGYWDYAGVAAEVGAGWRWTDGHRVELSVRRSAKDYDNARVGYDAAAPLREKEVLNLRLRADYVLSRHWEATLDAHYKDADNNSAAFAYRRAVVVAGLAWSM